MHILILPAIIQVFMYLAGSLARIFTTMREVGDSRILAGFVAGFLLNAVLAAQMVYYWKSPNKQSKATLAVNKKEKGKQPQEIMAFGSGTSGAPSTKTKTPTTRRRG